MSRSFFILVLIFLLIDVCVLNAQNVQKVGVVNSSQILDEMPERKDASAAISDINQKYKDELVLMQADYNKKYSDFISYQSTMGDNIRVRRMQELFELERHIKKFMLIAQTDVQSKEKQFLNPLKQKVKEAIYQVGVEQGLVCVYDLADPAIAFITPDAMDINSAVEAKLNIKK